MSKSQLQKWTDLAKKHGFEPLKKDPPHFQADATKHGYKSRSQAIKQNQAHYNQIMDGSACPCK